MITSKSLLRRGRYYHTSIEDVPAAYLLEIFKTEPDYTELYTWLSRHHLELLERFDREKHLPPPPEPEPVVEEVIFRNRGVLRMMACPKTNKFMYPDKATARRYLREQREQAIPGRKIPVRTYECPYCGAWHLTSREAWKWAG